jgi:hypothetical protein
MLAIIEKEEQKAENYLKNSLFKSNSTNKSGELNF